MHELGRAPEDSISTHSPWVVANFIALNCQVLEVILELIGSNLCRETPGDSPGDPRLYLFFISAWPR